MDAVVGGQIKGISLDSFLQMMQMERSNCTLKVTRANRSGYLYVLEGELISAELETYSPFEAACHLVSWQDPVIEINQRCERLQNEIKQPLMHILMEGLRLRDEGVASGEPPGAVEPEIAPDPVRIGISLPQEPVVAPALGPVPTAERDVLAERKRRRKKRLTLIAGGVAAVVAVVAVLVSFSTYRAYRDHRQMLDAVAASPNPSSQIQIIDAYLAGGVRKEAYRRETDALRVRTVMAWQEESFAKAGDEARAAEARGRLDLAVAQYQDFLKHFSAGPAASEAKTRITELQKTLAENAHRRLMEEVAATGPLAAEACGRFLGAYPDSRHADAVRQIMSDLREDYALALEARIDACRQKEDWKRCIELAGHYEALYGDDNRTRDFRRFQDEFVKKAKDQQVFDELMAIAAGAGSDLKAARKVFSEFLKTVPDKMLRDKVTDQIARIDRDMAAVETQKRIQEAIVALAALGERFLAGSDGTFKDRRSGLTWCLVDSLESGRGCMNFASARHFVEALTVGGYQDWRLPTVKELAGLYKTAPFFPAGQAPWYWSAETYTRYVGLKKVDNVKVVTVVPETDWQVQSRDTQQCGAARAVRP